MLAPRIMRRPVQPGAAAVLLAGLIGGATLGLIGALVAVPVAAGTEVLLSERLQARDTAGTDAAARVFRGQPNSRRASPAVQHRKDEPA